MNELDYAKSRKDIERYVLRKLQEIYWEFPWKISPNTTFEALDRHADPDLTDPGLLMDIEEDLAYTCQMKPWMGSLIRTLPR